MTGGGRQEILVPLYLFTQIPECPDDQPSLAFSLPSSRVAQACGGGPLTLTLGPGERNNQALLAAPVQGGRMGGGSGGPGQACSAPPSHTLTVPCPAATHRAPARRSPRGAGTLCKVRSTYIGQAVRRARAAPLRSAPLPAAAVLLR